MMVAMSELDAETRLLAELADEPGYRPPEPPPVTCKAKFAFHDGHLWRLNSSSGWQTCDDLEPLNLLRLYRKDAAADDWWAPFAAVYAADLEAAMREAGMIQTRKRAA